MKSSTILLFLTHLYQGNWDKVYNHIINKLPLDTEAGESYAETVQDSYTTITDLEFPVQWKINILHPPFIIFKAGENSLLSKIRKHNTIAFMGSQHNYTEGAIKEIVNNLFTDLPSEYIIVTGWENVIHTTVIETAIKKSHPVVIVLNHSLSKAKELHPALYDKVLQNHGLFVTEYPDDIVADEESKNLRMRLIASMSDLAVLIDTDDHNKKHSDATIFVAASLNAGTSVGAVPRGVNTIEGAPRSYCNQIIREGGALIENGNDIVFELK